MFVMMVINFEHKNQQSAEDLFTAQNKMKCYQLWQYKRAPNKLENEYPFLQSGRVKG